MEQDKIKFLELLLSSGVLQFGAFTTKAGRQTPYFFNTGRLDSAYVLGKAAEFYAQSLHRIWGSKDIDCLFGPAYKGIPLATMVADRLARLQNRDVAFAFNRKEAKDHGEGGEIIGHGIQAGERVVIIEDVLTQGTSIRQVMPILKGRGAKVIGIQIGIDRQEKDKLGRDARAQVELEFGTPVQALLTINEMITGLEMLNIPGLTDEQIGRIKAYLREFGS